MRKNREKIRNFYEKTSLELIEGWIWSKRVAYPIHVLAKKNLAVLWPSSDSSLFQKTMRKFENFSDYVIGYDVIGHDVIGIPVVQTDNTGVGQYGIENRLVIHGLQQMFWPN